MASVDDHALVKNLDESDWLPVFAYFSEWTHQWLDYITRTTGRLTKNVRLANMTGVKLSGVSPESGRRMGKAMEVMEDCYPQLLHGIFMCNPPIWVQIPWRIFRPLLPKRVVQKMDFIAPAKNEKERQRLFAFVSEANLPIRFGGKYETWPIAFSPPL